MLNCRAVWQWQALLESVVAAPDERIDRITFVPAAEQELLLDTFNAVALAHTAPLHSEQTIHGLLEHWAEATPHAPAVVFEVIACCAAPQIAQPLERCNTSLFCLSANTVPRMLNQTWPMQDDIMTYSDFDHRANQLAHRLIAVGVGPDVPVGVMIPRSLHLVVALLGVLKAGGAYVPMDPDYPPDRLAMMLEDSEVSFAHASKCAQ